MSQDLFRPEMLAARRDGALGAVQLVQPVSLWWLTAVFSALALSAAAYLWWGEATRKVRVSGVLAPDLGLIPLATVPAGTVRERPVSQGQAVRAGDVLFVLSLPETVSVGATQRDIQRSIEQRESSLLAAARDQDLLDRQTLQARTARMLEMQGEQAQIDAELRIQRQRLAMAEQNQARFEALRDQAFVSPAQVQTQADVTLELQAQVQGLERQRAAQSRAVSDLRAEIRELPLRAAVRQGEIDRERALLQESGARNAAQETSRQWVIRAPADGTVAAMLAEVGQSVGEQQTLARLVPAAAQLQAQLFVPSSAVGFVQPGQAVALRVHAFAHEKFGSASGRVLAVSQAPWSAEGAVAAAAPGQDAADDDPIYRVTVSLPQQHVQLQGRQWPLMAGMQLDADVLLERRRLLEWLFAPLLAGQGRL